MQYLRSIYNRIPTSAFVFALVAIFVAALLLDRAERARYRKEMCRYYQTHGWPDAKCPA